MNRRELIGIAGLGGGAVAVGGLGLAVLVKRNADAWANEIETQRRPLTPASGLGVKRELIRYATLAANSHNTQPWRFAIASETISILPDLDRRCPVVDPDDHHLHASLGCAVENLVHAAPLLGLRAVPQLDASGDGRIVVTLTAAEPTASPLGEAIPHRQCTRAVYGDRPVPPADIKALEAAAQGEGVDSIVVTDRAGIDEILAFIVDGNARQIGDPAFVAELKQWIRFSYADALASRDGLFAAASGNPVLPHMVGKLLFGLVFSADAENKKTAEQVRSSAGIAVFVSERDDLASRIAAGRAYQRFALTATTLGIRHAFVNQAVEVADVRQRFAEHLKIGNRRPDFVVRFGYGPDMPRSLRRPVDQVLI